MDILLNSFDALMPSVRKLRPFAKVFVSAACTVMVTGCACTGNRAVNSAESPAKVGANRSPLTLEEISRLERKTFETSLPQLQDDIQQSSHGAADLETLTAIRGKLQQADESAWDYWPTVLRFLQFASSRMAPNAPPSGQPARALTDILWVGIMRGIRPKGKTILFDGGSFGNSDFTDCRIIFTQNPVEMHHVVFRECTFEFPTTETPSPYLKKVCRILLASDLGSVSIPTL